VSFVDDSTKDRQGQIFMIQGPKVTTLEVASILFVCVLKKLHDMYAI
jgi:hypothetical protein